MGKGKPGGTERGVGGERSFLEIYLSPFRGNMLNASGSMESFNISVLEVPQSVGFQAEEKPLPV